MQQILRERTGNLSEVLEVEEAVDRTRGENEAAEAEQKALSNQITVAGSQLSVSEEYEARLTGANGSVLTQLRNPALDGFKSAENSAIDAVAFLLSMGPGCLLVVGLGFFPARWLLRKWRTDRPVQ